MEIFILILSLILQAAVLRHISLLRHTTQHCTAEPARRWAMAACLCSLTATALQGASDHVTLQWRTAALHLAVVGQLTPLICILGARRPGVRAWPWFVIVPMIAVFQWPSVSQIMAESADTSVVIERPSSMGLILVVVMGAGNYFGTRFTGAAILGGLGIVLQHLAVSEWTVDEWVAPANGLLTGIGSVTVSTAVLMVRLPRREADSHVAAWQELWKDYRDVFGIVWAKRVADRVNQFAAREGWALQLTLDGFAPAGSPESMTNPIPADNGEIDSRQSTVLCWILRRFVDRGFLERYVPASRIPPQTGPLDQPPVPEQGSQNHNDPNSQ